MCRCIGACNRPGQAIDEEVQDELSPLRVVSEADRCSNGIRSILGGVQCGTLTETEEAECPFTEIGFLYSEGLRRYGERLIDDRPCDGEDRLLPWRELDLRRPAYLCRLLQVKEEIAVSVADERFLMAQTLHQAAVV